MEAQATGNSSLRESGVGVHRVGEVAFSLYVFSCISLVALGSLTTQFYFELMLFKIEFSST